MHQILFQIHSFHLGSHFFSGFSIYTYGVMLSIAFGISLAIALMRAKAVGFPTDVIADISIAIILAGIVGARLLFVLEDWSDYSGNLWGILNIREGGLSLHGGLIAGFLVGLWYAKKHRLDFWKGADILSPAMAIGMGIGRIGCFFNGCCVGIPTKLRWGVVFKDSQIYFGPRHPTQIYEMILDFLIAGYLLLNFKKTPSGVSFLWFCILTSISRFFIEFLRADAIWVGPLSLVQILCLLIIGVAGIFIIKRNQTI